MDNILPIALNTVEEMLEDRDYIPIATSIPEIDILIRMNNRKYITPSGKLAFVVVINSSSQIKTYSSQIEDENYETIIFIYTNNVTATHRSIEQNLNNKVEIWSVYHFLVNVSRHFLQPKVRKVTDIKLTGKIPKISFYDPIVRYYHFQPKDILEITNKEGFVNYRMVC